MTSAYSPHESNCGLVPVIPSNQWLFLVAVKGGLGGIYSHNWQYIHVYTTYIPLIHCLWGVLCYPPPFLGTRNNHRLYVLKDLFFPFETLRRQLCLLEGGVVVPIAVSGSLNRW